MHALAAQLFREVPPEFFRVLSGPLARLYVDALDALERESSQRNQGLDREEALALVEQAVEQHSDLATDGDDPVAKAITLRDKARAVVDTLRAAGWLTEEERSDWQKLVIFDPNGVLLIQAIK